MMQITDAYALGDGGFGASPGSGGDITGGTDPNKPPDWAPGDSTGWWEFIDGVWRWITEPPGTVAKIGGY